MVIVGVLFNSLKSMQVFCLMSLYIICKLVVMKVVVLVVGMVVGVSVGRGLGLPAKREAH